MQEQQPPQGLLAGSSPESTLVRGGVVRRHRPARHPPGRSLPSPWGLEAQTPQEGLPSLPQGRLPRLPDLLTPGAMGREVQLRGLQARSWFLGFAERGSIGGHIPLIVPCGLRGWRTAGRRPRGLLRNRRPEAASKDSWQLTVGQEEGLVGYWSQMCPSGRTQTDMQCPHDGGVGGPGEPNGVVQASSPLGLWPHSPEE